ncbi:hypothetical protein GCM10009720_28030 [Yaniella flava]|uniref:Uncharacterized protein n=1 Tax=Yaniella flava TaxID=287930 RepID=A0ABP5GJ35_9MICC
MLLCEIRQWAPFVLLDKFLNTLPAFIFVNSSVGEELESP